MHLNSHRHFYRILRPLTATLALLCLFCTAYAKGNGATTLLKVTQKRYPTRLHFYGTLQPAKLSTLTAPEAGIIQSLHTPPRGKTVNKDTLLITLRSDKMQNHFRTVLMQYMNIQSQLESDLKNMTNAKLLFKKGVISQAQYQQTQRTHQATALRLLEIKEEIYPLLPFFMPAQGPAMHLNNMATLKQLINTSPLIHITAPHKGSFWVPPPDTKKSNTALQKMMLSVGMAVKKADILGYVADLTQVAVWVWVNENQVEKIQKGSHAIIRNTHWGQTTLSGSVNTISFQPVKTASETRDGLALFGVHIMAHPLPPAIQKQIHPGMRVAVELIGHTATQIRIPLTAIHENTSGASWVIVVDESTQNTTKRTVHVQQTQVDTATISAGLKVGELIQVPAP